MDDHLGLLASLPASSLTLIHPAQGSQGDPSKTPLLKTLHWGPHCYRVRSKLLTLHTKPSKIHPCHLPSLVSHHVIDQMFVSP